MDFELSEEQRAFRKTARDFAEKELAPQAARWDAEEIFPKAQIARAGALGFCALSAPAEIGGLGLPRLDSVLIVEELARGCCSTTAFITIHAMALGMLARWGTEPVKRSWGPDLAAGRRLASYCLTESEAGSDAASLRSKAERRGDVYVLNGEKAFISGAGETDLLVVMARTGGPGAQGISAFAVPADLPGISYGGREKKMGWNSQPTGRISFDDVSVSASHRLGAEGEGFKIALNGLNGGRLSIAACSLGTAASALERARRYMQERRQFGRRLADFQALQFKLADMATDLAAARQLVYLAAHRLDRAHRDAPLFCAMAKRLATDSGFAICNAALQIHGGYGYLRAFPLERQLRDLRVHQILEGTNEIMRLIIARGLLRAEGIEDLS